MPKAVTELERAERSLPEKILEVLSSDPNNAYTLDELYAQIQTSSPGGRDMMLLMLLLQDPDRKRRMLAPYEAAVGALLQQSKVRVLSASGVRYFALAAGTP